MTANPLTPIPPIGPTTAIGPPPTATRFKPLDPLKILRQYARLLVISCVVGVVLGVITWAILWLNFPSYESKAQLLVSNPKQLLNAEQQQPTLGGVAQEPLLIFMRTEVVRILSEDVISNVIKREDVRNTDWYKSFGSDTQRARESLQEDLVASPIQGTSLINLAMRTRKDRDAPVILDAVINVYLDQRTITNITRDTTDLAQLRRMADRQDDEIRQLGDRMRSFRENNDLPKLELAGTEATIQYNILAEEEAKTRLMYDRARSVFDSLKQAQQQGVVTDVTPEDLQMAENDLAIRTLDERLRVLRQERETHLGRFGTSHPFIREYDRRLDVAQSERKQAVDRLLVQFQAVKLDQAGKNAQSMESMVASMQPKLQEARTRMTELTNRLQEYKSMEEQLDLSKKRKEQIDNTLFMMLNRGVDTVVTKQSSPTTPELVFPMLIRDVPLVTILFVGLVTGLIFLVELIDQRMKSPSDVKLLPNAELLGVLPDGAEDPSGSVPIESVVKHYPTGLMAESFRHVRTALLTRMDRRGYKTLVVVGAKPGSGTSAIVGNLALSLAYNGRKVLVIDANFRRPSQHQMFDVPRDPGLVDVLQNGISVDKAIRHTNEPAMSILPAGTAEDAPPELLEGPQFRRMLTTFEAQYDMVIIDAPPALLASEGQLLAKHVDALALVVRAMNDKRGMVERMLRVLDGQRADVLGIILNGVRSTAGGYLRQSYQEFYRYRSGASSKAAYGARRTVRAAKEATNGNGHTSAVGEEPTNGGLHPGRAASDLDDEIEAQLESDDERSDRA